jgi:hypothetical protein
MMAALHDFFRITVPAFIGRLLRLPVCDCCSTVEWQGTAPAYALGWRSTTGGFGPDFWNTLCPDCQEGPEVMW